LIDSRLYSEEDKCNTGWWRSWGLFKLLNVFLDVVIKNANYAPVVTLTKLHLLPHTAQPLSFSFHTPLTQYSACCYSACIHIYYQGTF